jgi:hypothetical protein
MPTYCFESIDSDNKFIDIFYHFKDAPKIGAVIENEGKKWRRIPTLPYAASDTQALDPFDNKAFVDKTGKMKGTWGDMETLSSELSEKRAKLAGGEDPVLNKYEDQKQKATGLESFRRKKNKAKEKLSKQGIILE